MDHLFLGEGLHTALRILLALIESVSILFRAVSLSLRVVCNSIAGHLLLAVLLEMSTSSYYISTLVVSVSKDALYAYHLLLLSCAAHGVEERMHAVSLLFIIMLSAGWKEGPTANTTIMRMDPWNHLLMWSVQYLYI